MKNFLLTAVSIALSISPIHSAVISFTEAEGYADGNLKGQTPNSGYGWTYSDPASSYVVNTANGGSLTISDPSTYARYLQAIPITVGGTVSISMDLQFIGLDTTTLANRSAFSLQLGTDNIYNTEIKATVGTANWGPSNLDTYVVQQYTGTGTPATLFDPSSIGLTNAGGTLSDHLRITVSLATIGGRSDGATDYTITLFNLDTNTTVVTISGYRNLSSFSELYLKIGGATSPSTVTISQIEFTSTVPEPGATALLILGAALFLVRPMWRKIRHSTRQA